MVCITQNIANALALFVNHYPSPFLSGWWLSKIGKLILFAVFLFSFHVLTLHVKSFLPLLFLSFFLFPFKAQDFLLLPPLGSDLTENYACWKVSHNLQLSKRKVIQHCNTQFVQRFSAASSNSNTGLPLNFQEGQSKLTHQQ